MHYEEFNVKKYDDSIYLINECLFLISSVLQHTSPCRQIEKSALISWLGVIPSFTCIVLYSVREDPKTRIWIKTGRKWPASFAVQKAESRLKHATIEGTIAEKKQWLNDPTQKVRWRVTHRKSWDNQAKNTSNVGGKLSKAIATEVGTKGAWTLKMEKQGREDAEIGEIWRNGPLRHETAWENPPDILVKKQKRGKKRNL